MKKILFAMSVLSFVFSTTTANALLIEPFIGYQMGDYESGSTKEDAAGIEYGARLGASFTMFDFGVEYATGTLEVDFSPSVDYDTTDLGAFIAVNFPILLRAYFTYFVKSEAEPDTGGELEGSGYRLGVGFTGLPFVSLNLEMINRSYDEFNGSSVTDRDIQTTMLSVSLPLP